MLDVEEFAMDMHKRQSHRECFQTEQIEDKSGSLTQHETAAYIRSVTHGKVRRQENSEIEDGQVTQRNQSI